MKKTRLRRLKIRFFAVLRDCKRYLGEFRGLKRDFLLSLDENTKVHTRWKEYKIESLDGILYSKELVLSIDPYTMEPYSQIQYIYVYQMYVNQDWKKVFTKTVLTNTELKTIYEKWKTQ